MPNSSALIYPCYVKLLLYPRTHGSRFGDVTKLHCICGDGGSNLCSISWLLPIQQEVVMSLTIGLGGLSENFRIIEEVVLCKFEEGGWFL